MDTRSCLQSFLWLNCPHGSLPPRLSSQSPCHGVYDLLSLCLVARLLPPLPLPCSLFAWFTWGLGTDPEHQIKQQVLKQVCKTRTQKVNQEGQEFRAIFSYTVKASLGYMRPCLKKIAKPFPPTACCACKSLCKSLILIICFQMPSFTLMITLWGVHS